MGASSRLDIGKEARLQCWNSLGPRHQPSAIYGCPENVAQSRNILSTAKAVTGKPNNLSQTLFPTLSQTLSAHFVEFRSPESPLHAPAAPREIRTPAWASRTMRENAPISGSNPFVTHALSTARVAGISIAKVTLNAVDSGVNFLVN